LSPDIRRPDAREEADGTLGMLALLRKIKDSNVTLKGDLEFVNEWVYFSHGV
jgi:hypothetical protein